MSNGNLIICDPEEGYAQALAYYLMHKKEFGMEVQVYDRIEKVQEIADRITMEQLIAWDSVSEEVTEFLAMLVVAGYNIFISGGTGSGKTTFLNALSQYIPKTERIITIETKTHFS